MTDIIDYDVESLTTSVFNPPRKSLCEPLVTSTSNQKKYENYYDLVSLIAMLTSSSEIDYQLIGDFFLTFRSFISPESLLKVLMLRLQWSIELIDNLSHEKLHNTGKLVMIRTFVVIRHWILNYFGEDFLASKQLRTLFIGYINGIIHNEVFVQRIIANLKKTWTECCNRSWDEKVIVEDYYTFTLKVGPQDSKYKRFSTMAIDQQTNPMVRNSTVLSTFDPNKVHKLPMPSITTEARHDPKLLLNLKNSNLNLKKGVCKSTTKPSQSLYTSLTPEFYSNSKNAIRDATDFPVSSTLSSIIPPTPVKKMDIVVPLPPVSKPQPKRGLIPLIESWMKTFQTNNEHNISQSEKYPEKFMRSVVSVPKLSNRRLNELVEERFDILGARTIDELEYLVKFHNELMDKYSHRLGLNHRETSFSFAPNESKKLVKAPSNVDTMNICATISNISRSVISLKQLVNGDNKSYISYDSKYSKENVHTSMTEEVNENGLKKKRAVSDLREFNFEVDSGSPHNDFEENAEPDRHSFASSILSESTPNTISQQVVASDVSSPRPNSKSTLGVEHREFEIYNGPELNQTEVTPIEIPLVLNRENVIPLESSGCDIPPRSPARIVNFDKVQVSLPNNTLNEHRPEVIDTSEDELDPKASTQSEKNATGDSNYDDLDSFISSFEESSRKLEEMDLPNSSSESNHSISSHGPMTPPPTTANDGLISSTPHISPIKPLNESASVFRSTSKPQSPLELDRSVSFRRVSNASFITETAEFNQVKSKNTRGSYLASRSDNITFSNTSGNSVFTDFARNERIVNISVTRDNDYTAEPLLDGDGGERSKSLSLIDSIKSNEMAIPYPGVDSDVMAELAAIGDGSMHEDPIAMALLKLEGNYKRRKFPSRSSSVHTSELLQKVESLRISPTPQAKELTSIDGRRKTKLLSLTPVKQKDIACDINNSKLLLELLLHRNIIDEALMVSNAEQHVPFILNYDSKTLSEQLTLIEKDCLLEIDWKELVDFKWDSSHLSPINSWLELLIQSAEIQGINLCISRFNLTVNWIISEILLTKDVILRKLTIQRFIHIAEHCKKLQNYSTLMQILLALGSDKIMRLKDTWRIVEPGDILIFKNLETVASPMRNFINLRNNINMLRPSLGCVPFLGLYLSDLIFNREKHSCLDNKVNFGKFMHDSKIVRSLIQCIQWSMLYHIEPNEEVLSKCLYIKSLTEEEMNTCLETIC